MASKKPRKEVDEHLAELEAVMTELGRCAACGELIEPEGAATCPHCGTPVGEAVELHEEAEKSLTDLEKQLAETSSQPAPPARPETPMEPRPAPKEVPETAKASPPATASLVSKGVAAESVMKEGRGATESKDLGRFVQTLEVDIASGKAALEVVFNEAGVSGGTARGGARTDAARKRSWWIVPVAVGGVLYRFPLFVMALLGRVVVASFMVLATLLVAAGIRARPPTAETRDALLS